MSLSTETNPVASTVSQVPVTVLLSEVSCNEKVSAHTGAVETEASEMKEDELAKIVVLNPLGT